MELGDELALTERPTIAEFLAQIFTNGVYRAPFTELGSLVVPPEVRAIPERGLCKCARLERVEFFAQPQAEFEPLEGTVYVPESVERIGTVELPKRGEKRQDPELERLAYCVLVRVPEQPARAPELSEGGGAVRGVQVACE